MRLRRKLYSATAAAILAAAALAGCSSGTPSTAAAASGSSGTAVTADAAQSAATVLAANKAVHTTDATLGSIVDIDLAASGKDTVTITEAGTYRLHGKLAGQVVVTAPDAVVTLVLDGVDITSTTTAAIAASEVDRLVVVLADGSTNTLRDTGSYAADADVNAALFSAGDLTIAGSGALSVHGTGNDGIASKDGLAVTGGTVTIDAVDDGIRGKDYLVISGGTVAVTAGGDGLKADNTEDADAGYIALSGGKVTVTAKGDGLDAATDIVTTGGELAVTAGGGSGTKPADDPSTKGIKSGVVTVLAGGTATVDSSDDAVHSDGAVHVDGSTLKLSTGDDAVHAEGALLIDKGTVDIAKSVEGLEGKDITVAGGTVNVVSSDDGINAAGGTGQSADQGGGGFGGGGGGGESVGDYTLTISGGTVVINANGDGFDSNGVATVTGGTLVVNGPTGRGNGALDVNGSFTVSGGVILAAGSAGMVVAPDASSGQGWLSSTLDTQVEAGTTLHVVDSAGKVVATFVTSKATQNIVYSGPGITKGQQYSVYSGGSAGGTSTGGLAQSGTLGSATKIATVTAGEAPARGAGGGPRR